MKNAIEFDFADNPDLKAAFAGWEVGESYEVTVKFQLNEMSDVGAKGTVEGIEIPSEKTEDEETVKATEAEPVMIVIAAGRGQGSE